MLLYKTCTRIVVTQTFSYLNFVRVLLQNFSEWSESKLRGLGVLKSKIMTSRLFHLQGVGFKIVNCTQVTKNKWAEAEQCQAQWARI